MEGEQWTYDACFVIRKDIALDHAFSSSDDRNCGGELRRKIDSTSWFAVDRDDVSLS
jgi:hypothetical protein